MVYRVRYRSRDKSGQGEAVIEANSPNEAMVKFRTLGGFQNRLNPNSEVIGVRRELQEDDYR
jgi:hypothetical protein